VPGDATALRPPSGAPSEDEDDGQCRLLASGPRLLAASRGRHPRARERVAERSRLADPKRTKGRPYELAVLVGGDDLCLRAEGDDGDAMLLGQVGEEPAGRRPGRPRASWCTSVAASP
jgi:hypothetical protein